MYFYNVGNKEILPLLPSISTIFVSETPLWWIKHHWNTIVALLKHNSKPI